MEPKASNFFLYIENKAKQLFLAYSFFLLKIMGAKMENSYRKCGSTRMDARHLLNRSVVTLIQKHYCRIVCVGVCVSILPSRHQSGNHFSHFTIK